MKLRQYREKTKLTQKVVAEHLKITTTYYSDIERGIYKPGRKLADKIIKWTDGKVGYKDLWEKK